MSLTRQTQKVFASNANANQLAVFGSMKTGTPVYSTSLSTLQSTAYTEGWSEALLNDKAPYMEEMNAVQYGLSYQIAYLLQEGIPTYDANTNYSDTSIVKSIESGKLYFYRSLSDNNSGHALDNTTYWEKINISDTRNIGEIVTSTIPLTDAGLHLLDGSLLSGSGSYGSFVTYIAGLYTDNPNASYFTTEANWQTAVSTYGVCGKFVYDSVNNTVRLPKYSNKIYTQSIKNSAPVIGNGMSLGLSNGTTGYGINFQSNVGLVTHTSDYGASVGGVNTVSSPPSEGVILGVTKDPTKSGILAQLSDITTPLDGYYYIVIATSTKTQIEVDIDEIATDLNGKMDIDMSNMSASQSAKNAIVGWGMPDYANGISVTADADYTAPSDGWVLVNDTRAANGTSTLTINSASYEFAASAGNYWNTDFALIPVSKNDVIKLTAGTIKFYPCKGVN